MFFLKKQPDNVDLTHGVIEINNFLLDGWTTDELFLKIFGEDAAPSKKQATYVLRDTTVRLNDVEFTSVMVQFSPLGYHRQRVAENVTMYLQPCKYNDFTKRVMAKLPGVKPEVFNEYDLMAVYNGMKIVARLDYATQMASLNIEYLDSASRVDNWIREGCDAMVTPKSGAVKLFGKAYHANIRENSFKSEIMPTLTVPEECVMDDATILYKFGSIEFYDLVGDVAFGFLDGKLASIRVMSTEMENLLDWANRNLGKPIRDEGEYLYFYARAAGAREWFIRVYKKEPRMEWLLKMGKYT